MMLFACVVLLVFKCVKQGHLMTYFFMKASVTDL